MREDLKGKLDESVPEDVTLSDAKKRHAVPGPDPGREYGSDQSSRKIRLL